MVNKLQEKKRLITHRARMMNKEYWRKGVHLVVGIILINVAFFVEKYFGAELLGYIIFAILILSLLADFVMVELKIKLPIYHYVQRRKERRGLKGSTYFMMSTLIALQFFNFDIAIASIGLLVFGDTAAALVGKKWGKPWYHGKSKSGTIAMFLVSLIVVYYFTQNLWITLAMSIIGTLVELLVNKIDDNLVIPLFSGLAGQLVFYLIFLM